MSHRVLRLAPGTPRINVAGDTDRQVRTAEARRQHGQVVARALALANITPKQAQMTLGYAHRAQVAKWTRGDEMAPIDRLIYELPAFKPAYLQALAETPGAPSAAPRIAIVTTITIARAA